MRGSDQRSGSLFSYVDLEARVRKDHPLRAIREIVNPALAALHSDFEVIYASGIGRPSIPPERLLRALLLQAFYGIRSERQIMERLDTDLLFRWFVGLGIDDPAWDQTTFGKNRDRLLEGDVAAKFLAAVLAHLKVKRLLSTEHFSVDGTLIEAWASSKSFRPKEDSDEPPAGGGRNGLIVDACLTQADGHAERIAALHMIEPRGDRPAPITLGADKGYDAEDFVNELRSMNVSPPMWRRKPKDPRSTDEPHGMLDIGRAKSSANGLRKRSAGRSLPPDFAKPNIAALIGPHGSLR